MNNSKIPLINNEIIFFLKNGVGSVYENSLSVNPNNSERISYLSKGLYTVKATRCAFILQDNYKIQNLNTFEGSHDLRNCLQFLDSPIKDSKITMLSHMEYKDFTRCIHSLSKIIDLRNQQKNVSDLVDLFVKHELVDSQVKCSIIN